MRILISLSILALTSPLFACGGGGGFFSGYAGGCGSSSYVGGCGSNTYFGGSCGSYTVVDACAPQYTITSGCGDCSPVEKTYKTVPLRPEPSDEPQKTSVPTPAPLPPAPALPENRTSYKPVQAQLASLQPRPGKIILHVPNDAQVWINGHNTKQTGKIREYEALLKPGQNYQFKIIAQLGEKKAVRNVVLRAGEIKEVR